MISVRQHHAAVCAAIAIVLTQGCSADSPDAGKKPDAQPVRVHAVVVAEQEVRRTTLQPATVVPFFRAEIRAKVSGYLNHLSVDIGDFVKTGDTLAVIDVPEIGKQRDTIQARLGRLKAEEQLASAEIAMAEANVTAAVARVEQAKSLELQAKASLAATEAEFKRVAELVEGRALESRMLDEAREKRDSDKALVRSTASSIDSATAEVLVARAKLKSAEAGLAAARAETQVGNQQAEELDVMLAYAVLKAPFAGVITARSVDPGDLVREGSDVGKTSRQPLFVISQIDQVRIQVPVPEADAALVNKGDQVALSFPSYPAESLTATVSRLSHSLDPSTRTMLVEADFDNPQRKLLPGMFGQASITLSTKTAASMLPARAIRMDETGQAYVYVVGDDDRVSITMVETGMDDGHSIEILAGVRPGDRVVDAHLQRFSDGQRVAILEP